MVVVLVARLLPGLGYDGQGWPSSVAIHVPGFF